MTWSYTDINVQKGSIWLRHLHGKEKKARILKVD